METWTITEPSELETIATRLRDVVAAADTSRAVVVGLSGNLGAGKTTFMQTLARQLGVAEAVTSPTFVIMKGYELDDQPFEQLIHVDAYRIESDDELLVLGWQRLLGEPRTLICLEWPEKVSKLLPSDTVSMTFTLEGDGRIVTLATHHG